jgi:small subunit ribosomal protein S6
VERYYETIFILRPTLNDQEISEAIDNYKDLLVRHGADMFRQEDLGKKKLAYLIKKFQNGHYALYQYKAEATAVAELERSFKISEDVLRYLTVKLDEKNPPTRAPEESDDTEAESGDTPVAAGDAPAVSADAPAVSADAPAVSADAPADSGDAPKEEEA